MSSFNYLLIYNTSPHRLQLYPHFMTPHHFQPHTILLITQLITREYPSVLHDVPSHVVIVVTTHINVSSIQKIG